MKVAIIGSRDFKNKNLLDEKMKEINKDNIISLIVSGGAKGADTMGVQWANKNNIETKVFYPDFKKYEDSEGMALSNNAVFWVISYEIALKSNKEKKEAWERELE